MPTRVNRILVSFLTILMLLSSAAWQVHPPVAQASADPSSAGASVKPQEDVVVGEPWTGDLPVEEDSEQAMQQAPESPEASSGPETDSDPVTAQSKEPNPDPDLPADTPQDISGLLVEPQGDDYPSFVQRMGLGLTAATWSDSQVFPPDPGGAVGPSHIVLVTNGRYRSFLKNRNSTGWDISASSFWSSVGHTGAVVHPRVRYDPLSARFYIIAVDSGQPSNLMIAVSSGSTALTSTFWRKYSIDIEKPSPAGDSTCQARDPSLGIDKSALYIGVNNYCGASRTPGKSSVYVVRKSTLISSTPAPIVVTAFRSLGGSPGSSGPAGISTPQGVDNYNPAATTGFFIGVDSVTLSKLVLLRIANPGSTPSKTQVTFSVPATQLPKNTDHKGNATGVSGYLNALDDRLYSAFFNYKTGKLWTTHTVGVNKDGLSPSSYAAVDRNGMRWYELGGITSGVPAVSQSGTSFDASTDPTKPPRSFLVPTIMTNGQGHTVLAGSYAGKAYYIGAFYAGRGAKDNKNLMINGSVLAGATDDAPATYNPTGDRSATLGARPWGAYSTTTLDACDNMTIWTFQEYVHSYNNWGIRITPLMAPPPPAISSVNPAVVVTGQTNINVSIAATSSYSTAFYDPGAGFACRLKAAASGITINSVTYVDPTHLTIKLSVPSSTPAGDKTLIITNPDGQMVTTKLKVLRPTTTTLTSLVNPTYYGDAATFTAEVKSGDGVFPTGTVKFYHGSTLLGANTLYGAGQTSITNAELPAGYNDIKAVYYGDSTHPGSTSNVLTQVVEKVFLTITPNDTTRQYGSPIPAFSFTADGFKLGQGLSVIKGSATYITEPPATLTSPPGIHTIKITSKGTLNADNYDFDIYNDPSKPAKLTIVKNTPTTALYSTFHAVRPGQPVTIFVKVIPGGGGTIYPTGEVVTIKVGASEVKLTLNSSGSATWVTSWPVSGTYTLTASYGGNVTFFNPSNSSPLVIKVGNFRRIYMPELSKLK